MGKGVNMFLVSATELAILSIFLQTVYYLPNIQNPTVSFRVRTELALRMYT
jgi:hypothetical protein